MHRAHTTFAALALSAGLLSAPACSFVEEAATLVLGADQGLPSIHTSATLETRHINNAISKALEVIELPDDIDPGQIVLALEPTYQLDDTATWADVRAVLCRLARDGFLDWPSLEVAVDAINEGQLHGIRMMLEVPVTDADDYDACMKGDLAGEMRGSFAPLAVTDIKAIEEQMGDGIATLSDALVQVRFLISTFSFYRPPLGGNADDATPDNAVLNDFHLAVVEPNIIDDPRTPYADGWLELVPHFLLESISETTPQRFELDPDSPVTNKLRGLLNQPPDTWEDLVLTVEARAVMSGAELLDTPLAGSGMTIRAQPEVVIDGLQILGL